MKSIHRILPLLVFIPMIVSVSSLFGQSLVIGTVPASQFCAGDSLTINFSVTGNFGHKNAFTLQLSDISGSFQNGFRNIGSVIDSLSGPHQIAAAIPIDITASLHYRFRVIAAVPYTTSADNGSDIMIGSKPSIGWIASSPEIPFAGDPIQIGVGSKFRDTIPDVTSVSWDFGVDAIPPTATGSRTQSIVYSKGGDKLITVTVSTSSGCSSTSTLTLKVLDCMPSIPKNAIVVNDGSRDGSGSSVFWVNPGVTFGGTGSSTIFAEPGSTILNNGGGSNLIYLKTGASYLNGGGGSNIIVYADGASIPANFSIAYKCASLDFDYTNAPPNKAHPLGVTENIALASISLFPNPTNGIIALSGIPSSLINVDVLNILGATVMNLQNPHSPDFTLDLSKLVQGTYYLRFSSANSVVTKMVVRE